MTITVAALRRRVATLAQRQSTAPRGYTASLSAPALGQRHAIFTCLLEAGAFDQPEPSAPDPCPISWRAFRQLIWDARASCRSQANKKK